jgi:hypothetical protein
VRKLRPTASRLGPDYLADFLPEQIWRTFYIVVLLDFLAYYFPRFRVQKDILSYLNITNWPISFSGAKGHLCLCFGIHTLHTALKVPKCENFHRTDFFIFLP